MKKSKYITITLFMIYIVILIWIILFKLQLSLFDLPHIRSINLIPFQESVIVNDKLNIQEIIYNIIVFIPFGLYISMLWNQSSLIQKVIACFFMSLSLEISQYIFAIGATDITDLLGNTLGGMIGIGIFYICHQLLKDKANYILNIVTFISTIFVIILLSFIFIAN